MTDLNELSNKIYTANKEKEFYDEPREIGILLMLIVSELSEALKADRKNKRSYLNGFEGMLENAKLSTNNFDIKDENYGWIKSRFEETIKDTFEDKIADAIIRLFDLCGYLNIDIDKHIDLKLKYNKTRPYKHNKQY